MRTISKSGQVIIDLRQFEPFTLLCLASTLAAEGLISWERIYHRQVTQAHPLLLPQIFNMVALAIHSQSVSLDKIQLYVSAGIASARGLS